MIIDKKSNVTEAVVGDIITYTLTLYNTDTFDYTDALVKDLLTPSLDFVEGSVTLDGASMPTASILSGVDVGPMGAGTYVTVEFKARVTSQPSSGLLTNQSEGYYTYLDTSGQTVINNALSNTNTITINVADILVTKTANQSIACLGSTITYTVTVQNTGSIQALSLIFKDLLPDCLVFVPNSFTLNGTTVNDVNLVQGVNLGDLAPGGSLTLTYQAKLAACIGQVCNQAFVEYEYEQANGVTAKKQSNVASTCIESRISFKQLMLDKFCEVPCVKPNIEDLNDEVTVDIEIINSYAIQTLASTSVSGQRLTGHKLIVHGNICISIEYTAALETQPVHSYHCTLPFGTFIVLPSDYQPGQQVEVNAIIENVEADMVSPRGVFTNITLLLIARVK